jgi:UDP-arabinose 4-epimerase
MASNHRLAVTGGAGYIGSHVAKIAVRAGHSVVTVDNLASGHEWAVRWGPLERGELGDREWLRGVFARHRIDAVLHFAADALVGESTGDPRKYFWNNVVSSLVLLDAMREAGIGTFVFSSTCATYGNPVRIPIDESHPQMPVNPYGESKLFVERVLKWYGEAAGLRWMALRYFNAAGADPESEIGEDHDPETHLIPLAIQAALGCRPWVEMYGTDFPTPDGTAVRDYIHVMDLADAHLRGVDYLANGGKSTALNLGTGKGHSVREVIETVARVTGRPVPGREAPRRAGDPPALVADPSAAREVLGWQAARPDLQTIVADAWRWHACGCRGPEHRRPARHRSFEGSQPGLRRGS